ncbi:thiolase family protein [Halieaceae bacterium IMCC14734]|uniref:Thiolase family protein n=1 Tax=Candidatus Litorirhabdus singularis TaxID=2518993 RepID=A0ABT3TCX0_9GAMM|nr:thiolase family protein [Candidatus Litorirhabdus singularis]MCX2980141.1 thiolase family protein [Candidatus Litorirhabdus singularis]
MDVAIVGIGMHPFGRTPALTGLQQGAYAAREALKDAGAQWSDMQFAYGGSASSGSADALVNELGLTGLPFTNVANGCATGGSSLMSAYNAVKSGEFDVGMVVGFDKHDRGAFNADPKALGLPEWYGEVGMMMTTQFFAMKITKYMHDFGITNDGLARVSEKAFINGAMNPNAWRRNPIGLEEIQNGMMVSDPLTKYMFCSPSEGGVALIVCRADQVSRYTDKPVFIKGAALRSRRYGSFEVFAPSQALEQVPGPTVDASKAVFEMAGMGPKDIDVAQLQDTEAGAEIMHMAENGFCEDGEQEHMLANGETRVDGRLPVNTDGGCIANGEPIGASGLRQIHENVVQLRGQGGERQVPGDPKVGYTHVYGAPGISAVTILQR